MALKKGADSFEKGVVNHYLAYFGVPAYSWLGDPRLALATISLLQVWQFGSSMILFLAGLKQIPGELYEAGKVDGASRLQSFWFITLPQLTPILLFNLVMQTVNAWTVNEPEWVRPMIGAQVDAIITNHPDRVRECLRKLNA
jgi:ABC-type sugar transport system permease subunit